VIVEDEEVRDGDMAMARNLDKCFEAVVIVAIVVIVIMSVVIVVVGGGGSVVVVVVVVLRFISLMLTKFFIF